MIALAWNLKSITFLLKSWSCFNCFNKNAYCMNDVTHLFRKHFKSWHLKLFCKLLNLILTDKFSGEWTKEQVRLAFYKVLKRWYCHNCIVSISWQNCSCKLVEPLMSFNALNRISQDASFTTPGKMGTKKGMHHPYHWHCSLP